jgi:uncharacterized protein
MMATAADEAPVFFGADGHDIFGIHTAPRGPASGIGIVIAQGGDTVNVSMLRNRMSVRLARRLAGEGHHVVRFDYRGLGESSGEIGSLDLENPLAADAAGAACHLERLGCRGVVLVGACFSGRTALAAAPFVDTVVGVVMSTPPVAAFKREDGLAEQLAREMRISDYIRRATSLRVLRGAFSSARRDRYRQLLRAKVKHVSASARARGEDTAWVSSSMIRDLDHTLRRNVPVAIVYGAEDPFLREFDRACHGRLGDIVGAHGGLVDVVRDLPGELHGFPTVASQEAFIEFALEWIRLRCVEVWRRTG